MYTVIINNERMLTMNIALFIFTEQGEGLNTSFLTSNWFYIFIALVIGAGLFWFFWRRLHALPSLYEKIPYPTFERDQKYSPPKLSPAMAGMLMQPAVATQNLVIAVITDLVARGKLKMENLSENAKWYQSKRFRFQVIDDVGLAPHEKAVLEMLFTYDPKIVEDDLWQMNTRIVRKLTSFIRSVEFELIGAELIDPLRFQHRKKTAWISIGLLIAGFISFVPALTATIVADLPGVIMISGVLFIMGIVGLIMSYQEAVYTPKGYEAFLECRTYNLYLLRALVDKNPELPIVEAVTYGMAFSMNYRVTEFLKAVAGNGISAVFDDETPLNSLSDLIKGLQAQKRSN